MDRKFVSQDRKIALIIGNCPAHPKVDELKTFCINLSTTEHSVKNAAYASKHYQNLKSILPSRTN